MYWDTDFCECVRRSPEPVILGRVHVWNSKSPDRQGLDVHLESSLSQLALGLNLATLGVVQNCVAETLEAGIVRAGTLALEAHILKRPFSNVLCISALMQYICQGAAVSECVP